MNFYQGCRQLFRTGGGANKVKRKELSCNSTQGRECGREILLHEVRKQKFSSKSKRCKGVIFTKQP